MLKTFYTQQFDKRTFVGISMKDAYMKACKWYATNVIAKGEMQSVHVEYVKERSGNAITLVLYASIPEEEIAEQNCECCREVSKSFLENYEKSCSDCKITGLRKKLKQKVTVKVDYYKQILKRTAK